MLTLLGTDGFSLNASSYRQLAFTQIDEVSPRFLLEIQAASISPEPIVGRVVTLHIELISTRDEPDTTLEVTLPGGVELVTGELVWQGALAANEPKAFDLSIRVTAEGEWPIIIHTHSRLSPTSVYSDDETLHIQSTSDSAQVIPSSEYTGAISTSGGLESAPADATQQSICFSPPSGTVTETVTITGALYFDNVRLA